MTNSRAHGVSRALALGGFALLAMAIGTQPAQAQLHVLWNFKGGTDGANPFGGLVADPADNLYGTTFAGGASNAGTVFKLDPKTLKETVLYPFAAGTDGAGPYRAVVRGPAGNLFGTTVGGGGSNAGTVFKVNPKTLKETVLYRFTGGTDGGNPWGTVHRDSVGNLYGTTQNGGAFGYGVVYKLDTTLKETVLWSFTGGIDGSQPVAGVILDSTGNLYGTTSLGGKFGWGVVFKLDPKTLKETVLWSFAGTPDGAFPFDTVIRDSAGNLYGTTELGGVSNYGVVFKLDTALKETVLWSFAGTPDGASPSAALIRDSVTGDLYGTTSGGGKFGWGTVFKLDPKTLKETVLYPFTGGADGGAPVDRLLHLSGDLYGTTQSGGAFGYGTVFKFGP